MKKIKRQSLILMLFMLVSPVLSAAEQGQDIAMKGNGKGAAACMACHGVKGEGQGQAAFPALAGLDAAYLLKQLNDFANKDRSNPVMAPNAVALSEAERKAVADYYASLPVVSESAKPSETELNLGRKLAENGNWDKDIPACFKCHGAKGTGIAPHFPALAGQHASYIAGQILAWKDGTRRNDPNQLMKGVAERLSSDEIQAVSAYLASLPAPKK